MIRDQHRILVVDDDFDERFLTQRALKKALNPGSSMFLASSGDEAIAYMIGEGKFADRKEHPFPTIIITDLKMPEGDGFDVLEFLQNNRAWSVIPRIVFTSSDDADDVRTAYALGASIYHVKPRGAAEMEKLLGQIIEYWSSGQVPPVDESGRLLVTKSVGRKGDRYPQPKGGSKMRRPVKRPSPESKG